MNLNFEKKKILRTKKNLVSLVNKVNDLDETSITYSGNLKDNFFLIIKSSIENALALKSKLPNWILNLEGLSGKKYRYLINNLIQDFFEPRYIEIGSWLGSTACSASYRNNLKILCIDNWSETFKTGLDSKKIFKENINKCTNKSNFKIIEENFKEIDYSKIGKFNIYFYDGPHHEKDHFDGVNLVQSCLEKKYILIIDDWNWLQVRKGTLKALKKEKIELISKIEIRTTQDNSRAIIEGKFSEWHNGYAFFVIKKL